MRKKLDRENGGKVLELSNYIKRVSLETGEEEQLMKDTEGNQNWGQSVLAYRNYVYFTTSIDNKKVHMFTAYLTISL